MTATASSQWVMEIAVPSPLYQTFDYLLPNGCEPSQLQPGTRVRVPFGRTRSIGVVTAVRSGSRLPDARLKRALEVMDAAPLLDAEMLALAHWTAEYYHHPLGEVLAAFLPTALRKQEQPGTNTEPCWCLTAAGRGVDLDTLARAPRQRALLERLREHPQGLLRSELAPDGERIDHVLRPLHERGWIEAVAAQPVVEKTINRGATEPLTLSEPQARAVAAISASLGHFQAYLLDGVTGSGKTEVYLRLIATVLAQERQALVLVPEIGLTPQLIERFRARFGVPIALLHSGRSERERLDAWNKARTGEAGIVLGTRSAVFTPLARPGLFIVDEEHDMSLKQQEGLRYSARDLLVVRAQRANVPVVLGSATPSLETLHNATQGRYVHLTLPDRAGDAQPPVIRLLDVRRQPMQDGLSQVLLQHVREHLARDGQVLMFLNRRGFAPVLMCHDCGWVADCRRCDAHLTFHQASGQLRCHHCGAQRPVDTTCGECAGTELHRIGQGTERVAEALAAEFPDVGIARIDRDSTRRKGSLDAMLEGARCGEHRILLGTQLLAKGHHFPHVTLVAILDADRGLFSVDFRASERMAQLIVQVAGRAGRAERAGEVLIQTHHPENALLQCLLHAGYPAFAQAALAERREAGLPPFSALAMLRAEATGREPPLQFLEQARNLLREEAGGDVELWGPVPAPMERRAGRYRAQLLLQASQRIALQRLLSGCIARLGGLPGARRVRWSIDVDPQETL